LFEDPWSQSPWVEQHEFTLKLLHRSLDAHRLARHADSVLTAGIVGTLTADLANAHERLARAELDGTLLSNN
jgi:hypothetical protein